MKINILGTDYKVEYLTKEQDEKLKECDGYCDDTIKECVIYDCLKPDPMSKADLIKYRDKCVRHELIHAFLFESGLACNSAWADNEEMVDWIAYQFPKMLKAFQDAKVL